MMLCRSKEKTDRKAPKTKGVSRVIRVSALFVATVFLIQLMVREPRGILALAEEILPETGVTQDADDTEEIVYEDEEGTEMVIPGEEGEPLSPDGEPLPMDTDGGTPEEPSEEPSGNPSDEPSGEEGDLLEDTDPDVTPNAVVPDITRNFFFTSPIRSYAENVKTMKVEKDKTYTMEEIFTAVQVTGKIGTPLTNECVISVTYNDTFFQLEKETVEETEYFTAIKVIKNFDQPQTVDITYKDPDDGNAEKTLSLELKDSRYITDLNLLLDEQKILIDGEGYEESGSNVLYNPRKLYTLQASFIENPYQQFANYEDLIYTLPQGFVLPEDFNETHQTVDIDMGINGRLKGNEVLAGDTPGTVIVRWNRDDPKFANFIASSNAKFTLLLKGTLDPTNGQVVFSTGKILNLEREDPDNAVVTKKVTINNASTSGSRRYVRYKVEVSSEGNTANLTLTDRMGSALIPPDASNVLVYFEGYNHMTSSGGSGEDVTYTFASDYQPTVSADPNNGFAVTIPKMDDYDVLVIEYECNVNVNKIEKSGAATFEEMGNTAEVTGDAHPEDNVATAHVKDVDFNDIDKTAVSVKNISISGDPYAEITWRVVTNRDRNIFLGGSDLTDTMGQMTLIQDVNNGNSDNVRKYAPIGLYAGDGISIEMVDKNGSTSTREVSWEAMGVDKSTAKTWTYHIPEEDDQPYQYTVTYTTRLSRTELLGQTSIPNSVSGKCGEDTAVVLVDKPGEGGIGVSKQATEILSDSVTWNVNVDIHKTKVDDTIKFSEGQPGDSGVFDNKNKYFLPRRWVTNKDPFTEEILYDSDGNPVGGKNYQETLQWVEIYGLKEGESVKAFYFIQVDNVGKDEELLESNGTRPSLTGVMTGAGPVRLDFSNSAVNTSNSVNKCFYMYFYKDAAQEHPGLNDPDTGEEYRKIQVRLHTTFPTEWAQQAQAVCDASSYYQPKLFTHQNWVMVNGVAGTDSFNTQSVGVYKLNYVNGTSKTINAVKKEIMYKEDGVTPVLDANGEPRTIDVTYPVYRFSISVNGINTNEPIVIKDYYDTTLFKQFDFMSYDHEYNSISTVPTEDGDNYLDWLCPTFSGQSEINGWGAKASLGPLCQSVGYFKHRADYSQGDRSDTATKDAQGRMHLTCPEFEVSMDETEDGAVFTFNDPSKFTNDAGQLCNFYSVDYYLVPRDREAIAKLEKMAAEAPLNGPLKGQAVCSNTAVCRDVSDSAIFTYSPGKALKPVTKYFRNVDENETAQHPLLKFTIDVNPGKLTLNDGNAMDVIDTYSDSISVDYKSVTVDTDPPNAPVTFDFRQNTGTFTIPDNTRVVINYDARVIAEPKDENGNAVTGDVSFDNTVQVLGYGAEVKGKATVSITSGGSAPTPMLYLFKYSDSHMEKGLNGVSFTMYEEFDDKFRVAEDGTTLYRESGDKRLKYADDKFYFNTSEPQQSLEGEGYSVNDDGKVYKLVEGQQVYDGRRVFNNYVYNVVDNADGKYRMVGDRIFQRHSTNKIVIDGEGEKERKFVPLMSDGKEVVATTAVDAETGKDGFARLELKDDEGGANLELNRNYYLHENEPLDGYIPSDIYYKFHITHSGSVDYSQYQFLEGDVLTVRNTPYRTSMEVTKKFDGNLKLSGTAMSKLSFKLEKWVVDPSTNVGDWVVHELTHTEKTTDENGQTIINTIVDKSYASIPFTAENFTANDDGTYTFVFSGLDEGSYRLTENGNDAVVTAYANNQGFEGQTESIAVTTGSKYRLDNGTGGSTTVAEFTVTQEEARSGNPRTMTFTNSYNTETVSYQVNKKWQNQSGSAINWPQKADGSGNAEVRLSVYVYDTNTQQPVGEAVRTVTLDGVADENGETPAGRAVFKDLPKYRLKEVPVTTGGEGTGGEGTGGEGTGGEGTGGEGTGSEPQTQLVQELIQYIVKEENCPNGYDLMTVGSNNTTVTAASGVILTKTLTDLINKKQAAPDITLTKTWDTDPIPTGVSAVLTLYGCPMKADGTPLLSQSQVMKTVTLDGTVDTNGETEAWKSVFTGLPLVSDDGSEMFYYVQESECTLGYEAVYDPNDKTATYAKAVNNAVTVHNRKAVTEFTVNKQWKGTNQNKWPNDEAQTIEIKLQRHEKGFGTPDSSFNPLLTFKRTVTTDGNGNQIATYHCDANGGGTEGMTVKSDVVERKVGSSIVYYYRLTIQGLPRYSEGSEGNDPQQWEYLAKELSVDNYRQEHRDKNHTLRTDGATNGGYIVNERITATLAVKKTVTGVFANRHKAFPFTVTLKLNGVPLTGTYECEKQTGIGSVDYDSITFDENGTAEVTLSHNQTLRILKLPLNATYTVTEKQEENESEYAVTAYDDTNSTVTGNSVAGTLSNGETDNQVSFVNHRETFTPPTGITLGFGGAALVLTGSLAGFILLRRRMRKRALHDAA